MKILTDLLSMAWHVLLRLAIPFILLVWWLSGGANYVAQGLQIWLSESPSQQRSDLLVWGTVILLLCIIMILLREVGQHRRDQDLRDEMRRSLESSNRAPAPKGRRATLSKRFNDPDFVRYMLATLPRELTGRRLLQQASAHWSLWQEHIGGVDRARHEALHATVAYFTGLTILRVTIEPPEEYAEHRPRVMASPHMDAVDNGWAMALTYLAPLSLDAQDGSDREDIERARRELAALVVRGRRPTGYLGVLGTDDLLVAARDAAAKLTSRHAEVVDDITEALRRSPTLGPQRIRKIVDRRLSSQDPYDMETMQEEG